MFNQTAIWWDLPPYQITIWLIDWWCNVCLLTWWIDSRFLLQQFDIGNRWIWTITLVLQANWVTKCTNHGWESSFFFQDCFYIKLLIIMVFRMFDIQYWKCNNICNTWKINKGKTKNLIVVFLIKHINRYF